MPLPLTPAAKAEIRRVAAEVGDRPYVVAERTGRTPRTVRKVLAEAGRPVTPPAPASNGKPEPAKFFAENADGTATAGGVTDRPVKSLADVVVACDIDLTVWHVDRYEVSAWTVGVKVAEAVKPGGRAVKDERVVQTQQYRVKAYLKRLQSRPLHLATEAIYERLASIAPQWPALTVDRGRAGEPMLGVLGLFDVHFGKLCWGKETGKAFDLETAQRLYANAVADLAVESRGRNVARWLLPIGNDFFHVDNSRNTTFNGTPQDVDGRYGKIIEAGELAVIRAVERLAVSAPVSVVWVPGNHDPTTSYHLARTVWAWFSKCDRVSVDYSPSPRKYFAWGPVLLGLTHGNEEKLADLPGLMATERPADWSRASCREWLLGHMHRSRKWQTQDVDSHQGTTVRVLRSLTGTDAWHHRKGYVGERPAAEVYWYGERRGYAGHAVAPARD